MYRNKLRRREALAGMAFLALPLAGFAVFYFVPFGITIARTFYSGMGRNFVGFDNYISVLGSEAFRLATVNTLRFIAVGVPVVVALSVAVALLLDGSLKGTDFLRGAYVLPLVIPTASVVMVFRIFFDYGGAVNYWLIRLGHDPVNFLRTGRAFWVLLLVYVWKNFGICVVIALVGLRQIPLEYYENARIDGAGPLRQFWAVTLPLMSQALLFVLVISIMGLFRSFREAFALAGPYPHSSIYMLQHFMNNNFARLNYARLSVAAVLMFLVIFGFVAVIFLWRKRADAYV